MSSKSKRPTETRAIRTISGRNINPKKPLAADFDIYDIAHALNNICRFAGHLPKPYSVAAHSIEVSYHIERNGGSPRECLTGLLHDASEAYLTDLPTPIKVLCPEYIRLERKFQKLLAKRFKLLYPFPMCVHLADSITLLDEKQFQKTGNRNGVPYAGRNCTKEFVRRFFELGGKL